MDHDGWKTALVGIAAGLVASLAMELAQQGFAKLFESDDSSESDDSEPATAKAARMAVGATGRDLTDDQAQSGGRLGHYATGTALGLFYALAAEREPRIASAAGLPLALGTMVLLDEVAVPAAGLGAPPTEAPASSHLLSLGSHLVFGVVAEGVRRLLGGRSPG
jgi:hypothetical protein